MKILFVIENNYPEGDAPSVRHHMLMKALSFKGHECTMICMSKRQKEGVFDGIPFISFRDPPASKLKTAVKFALYPSRLKKYLKCHQYDAVFCSQPLIPTFQVIEAYGKKTGAVIVQNMMDWFSSENYKSKYSLSCMVGNLYMEKLTRPPWRVLAISTMLEKHFKEKGCKTVRIPALMDFEKIPYKAKKPSDKVVIAYAGHPGTKDYLGQVILAAKKLTEEERKKLELRMIGPSEEEVFNLVALEDRDKEKFKEFLHVIPNTTREKVIENLQDADFTILIRDADKQYAKAGFPTKVVESLAAGTPVICNLSSDLELYLRDMENAVIVRDHSVDAVHEALRKVLDLSKEERIQMSINARNSGQKTLDYHVFADEIERIFQKA